MEKLFKHILLSERSQSERLQNCTIPTIRHYEKRQNYRDDRKIGGCQPMSQERREMNRGFLG